MSATPQDGHQLIQRELVVVVVVTIIKKLKVKYFSLNICAGTAALRDACPGDSGGPLILKENGRFSFLS